MRNFPRLIQLYESRGFTVRTSLTPYFLNRVSLNPDDDLSATYILRNGKAAAPFGGGLHLTEVAMLKCWQSAR